MKSYSKNKPVEIRNPYSTRPWQHVLDIIYGYLTLCSTLYKNKKIHGEVFNFGPSKKSNFTVFYILTKIKNILPNLKWKTFEKEILFMRSKLLKLNSNKAKLKLGWNSILTIGESIKLVSEWYNNFYNKKNRNKKKELYNFSVSQINYYTKKLKKL